MGKTFVLFTADHDLYLYRNLFLVGRVFNSIVCAAFLVVKSFFLRMQQLALIFFFFFFKSIAKIFLRGLEKEHMWRINWTLEKYSKAVVIQCWHHASLDTISNSWASCLQGYFWFHFLTFIAKSIFIRCKVLYYRSGSYIKGCCYSTETIR